MPGIQAVISDFGGVLTSPVAAIFEAFQHDTGVSAGALGEAMAHLTAARGGNPLYELETGRLSEADFLRALADRLGERLGRAVKMDDFGERYFAALTPNQAMIDYMRQLRERGYRLAICTNNVREWEQRWRAMIPVAEIFDVVVDSAFIGARKPEPRIYEVTLERLGVSADAALFIDDIEINCQAARELGMAAVWFRSTEQAMAEIEAALAAV